MKQLINLTDFCFCSF